MLEALVEVGLGLILGFLIGLTGVGGGALVAPALFVLLGLGYGESVAVSLVYSLFTKVVAAVQHLRQGTVLWRITLLYGLLGIPGAVVGSRLVHQVPEGAALIFPLAMGGILLLIAVLIFLESAVGGLALREKPFSPHYFTPAGIAAIAAFQLVVGVLMGVTSVGGGSLVILSMVYLFRMSAPEIVGSNIVIALLMATPASLTHLAIQRVNWRLLVLLLAGSLAGTPLGARAAMRVPDRPLKRVIALLVVVGAVATIGKAWSGRR
jgi:hypothetical protein